jgi:GT2 family glycosyltransferase
MSIFNKIINSKNPLVSVIVLNYNGKKVLKDCLESVFNSNYSPIEVIVVDNASTDGSDKTAIKNHSYKLIKNKANLGWCGGNNAGIRAAKGQFIILLNNDTEIDNNCISQLVQATIKGADFCAPKILLEDKKTINSTGLRIHVAGFGLLRGSGEIDEGQYNEPDEIAGFHGACIFGSKKAIEEVGPLDEFFITFNDDTDWSWKALLKGFKVNYVPSAILYHKWGWIYGTINVKKFRWVERNRLVMVLTNYSKRSIILLLPILALYEFATLIYCLEKGIFSAKIQSYIDLWLNRTYLIQRRRLIQKERKKTDSFVIKKFTSTFSHAYLGKYVSPLNVLSLMIWKKISKYI